MLLVAVQRDKVQGVRSGVWPGINGKTLRSAAVLLTGVALHTGVCACGEGS